jgi:hypothetical protein
VLSNFVFTEITAFWRYIIYIYHNQSGNKLTRYNWHGYWPKWPLNNDWMADAVARRYFVAWRAVCVMVAGETLAGFFRVQTNRLESIELSEHISSIRSGQAGGSYSVMSAQNHQKLKNIYILFITYI